MRRALPALWVLLWLPAALAAEYDYRLSPTKVAQDTYVFLGSTQDFSVGNGGNIVNTAFVVTSRGVVVIDTGPSKRYGEQMRAAIGRVTDRPVVKVFNTHHHPDHVLGNQAFTDVGVAALPGTINGQKQEGAAFLDNMYRLALDWMKDTALAPATQPVGESTLGIGDHEFVLLAFKGHTAADLAIFDRSTGVLFAGDLVFFNRAPTTPHADLAAWLAALDRLKALPFELLVPGHGPVVDDDRAIRQTRDYLAWLRDHLRRAAESGLDMTDLLSRRPPERFAVLEVLGPEYERSISHLYPRLEEEALKRSR